MAKQTKPITSPTKPSKKVHVGIHHQSKSIVGPQGQRLIPTVTQEMCGTEGLSGCMVVMPPGKLSKPHVHHGSEILVMVVEGYAATLVGEDMEPTFHGPGEFLYVPEGVPHTAVNLSPTNRLVAFEARTDPHFNEDVEHLPEYEEKVAKIASELQQGFSKGTVKTPKHWDTKNTKPFEFVEFE